MKCGRNLLPVRLVAAVLSVVGVAATYMECGAGVSLCGVLALESGLGKGYYEHELPSVHGLWPSTPPYGNSLCVPPTEPDANPTVVYECYNDTTSQATDIISFQDHEWIAVSITRAKWAARI